MSRRTPQPRHRATVPPYARRVRTVRFVNVGAKVCLLGLLAAGRLFPDLPRDVDKGMAYRGPVSAVMTWYVRLAG